MYNAVTSITKINDLVRHSQYEAYQNAEQIMLRTFWQISHILAKIQNPAEKAQIISQLPEQIGEWCNSENISYILAFKEIQALSENLGWEDYKELLDIENPFERTTLFFHKVRASLPTQKVNLELREESQVIRSIYLLRQTESQLEPTKEIAGFLKLPRPSFIQKIKRLWHTFRNR